MPPCPKGRRNNHSSPHRRSTPVAWNSLACSIGKFFFCMESGNSCGFNLVAIGARLARLDSTHHRVLASLLLRPPPEARGGKKICIMPTKGRQASWETCPSTYYFSSFLMRVCRRRRRCPPQSCHAFMPPYSSLRGVCARSFARACVPCHRRRTSVVENTPLLS